jgi:hypothetical protein
MDKSGQLPRPGQTAPGEELSKRNLPRWITAGLACRSESSGVNYNPKS